MMKIGSVAFIDDVLDKDTKIEENERRNLSQRLCPYFIGDKFWVYSCESLICVCLCIMHCELRVYVLVLCFCCVGM